MKGILDREKMGQADKILIEALKQLPEKPPDTAAQADKKRFSELLSKNVAEAFAEELRRRGLTEARPSPPGESSVSGAERRIAGGLTAKKVDITWATEESGLLLAISIKSINFKDQRTKNFQKNLVNRRGDMLIEAVTLHRRFPYAVMIGFLFFDKGAAEDNTEKRNSTFVNAHRNFRLFTGREDSAGRDEQFEAFYIVLLDPSPFQPKADFFRAGEEDKPVSLDEIFDEIVELLAERNLDFYEAAEGKLRKTSRFQGST